MAMRRIVQILVDLGFLPEDRVETILEEQQQLPGELFGQIAISMGLVTDEQLAQALAEQMGMQVINLADVVIPPEVLSQITEPMAQLYRIIPISFKENTLTIAMCDPQKLSIIDELRTFLGYDIRVVMAKARCLGGGTISYNTPSARIRILNSFSNGSKCRSLAWSLMASRSTMFNNFRTGALSARASTLVRSSVPSFVRASAAAASAASCSMSAISVSTLSPPAA